MEPNGRQEKGEISQYKYRPKQPIAIELNPMAFGQLGHGQVWVHFSQRAQGDINDTRGYKGYKGIYLGISIEELVLEDRTAGFWLWGCGRVPL